MLEYLNNWIYFFISFCVFSGLGSEVALLCSSCNEIFSHPWDLLVHVQKSHSLHIYEESDSDLISMSNVVSGINDQVAPSHMLLDGPGVIKSIWSSGWWDPAPPLHVAVDMFSQYILLTYYCSAFPELTSD